MDFRLGERTEAFRAEVRAFLDERHDRPSSRSASTAPASRTTPTSCRRCVERGWSTPAGPPSGAARTATGSSCSAIAEELSTADAPTYAQGTTMMVARVIAKPSAPTS